MHALLKIESKAKRRWPLTLAKNVEDSSLRICCDVEERERASSEMDRFSSVNSSVLSAFLKRHYPFSFVIQLGLMSNRTKAWHE
jgi:hypothetical protein